MTTIAEKDSSGLAAVLDYPSSMTTLIEKDLGLAAVLDYPSSKGVQTFYVAGGYSVWNCPPAT
jgi:hypothetical protein